MSLSGICWTIARNFFVVIFLEFLLKKYLKRWCFLIGIMDSGDDKVKTPITISVNKPKSDRAPNSEISVKQFLDFVKTAYQVRENIEGVLIQEGMTDVVDWIKLKDTPLVPPLNNGSSLALNSSAGDQSDLGKEDGNRDQKKAALENDALQSKLNDILQEGLLDSVLPYMVPPGTPIPQTSQRKMIKEKSNLQPSSSSTLSLVRRKSSNASSIKNAIKSPSEVEIHVCDEVKGVKKDFVCNQKLLVEQMGYFAEVAKDQRLDDMDISVHCDIVIFEWLMQWVKKDTLLEGDVPQLEPTNAIPILVSASFLQMEPLLQECLYYVHRHMNDILKTSTSLSCLNDSILTRLAAMYTNVEVENIRDRKDKIQSRLFCKLIQSLCEVEPESMRGHFNSLARLYKCKHCHHLITPEYSDGISCIPTCMSLEPNGSIRNKHVRDAEWDLNDFIVNLHKSLKTWRKVYWRLWGCAHYLYCSFCKKYFPARHDGWCRYHPDYPQFFTLDAQKPPLPVGRYPCCGERTYRFQLLEERNGCQCREHSISTKDVRDASVAGILDTYRGLITEEPPQLVFPDRLTRLVARESTDVEDGKLECKEVLWWEGLEIVPPRQKMGLLGGIIDGSPNRSFEREDSYDEEYSNTYSDSEESMTTATYSGNSDSSSTASEQRKKKKFIRKGKKKNTKLWQHDISARSNQDLQRANEEVAFKKIANILTCKTKKCTGDSTLKGKSRYVTPPGGIWVRLEADWRERNASLIKQKPCNGKMRMKTTRLT